MSKVIVFTNLTIDGVMQAPGRPDEDRRGSFEHGGWASLFRFMEALLQAYAVPLSSTRFSDIRQNLLKLAHPVSF